MPLRKAYGACPIEQLRGFAEEAEVETMEPTYAMMC